MHRHVRRWLLLATIFTLLAPTASALALSLGGDEATVAAKPGGGGKSYPSRMAALGDSITRAYNVDGSNWFEHPEHSWSTGYDSGDGFESHYERLLKLNRKISGYNYNDAVSGARMRDLAGQADRAVSQGAQYVTIQMGGNDLCTSSLESMTPTETYRTQFRAAADKLKAGLPSGAVVYVTSVPDVYLLWKAYDGHWGAEWTWDAFDICQSLLSNSRTEADRQLVRQRNIEFNQVLEQEAAAYGFVWDNWATFNTQFARSDISSVDYFHPSLSGQGKLAQVTWAAGPYA
jgi:lysophospholipase L1-like esterase